MKKIKLTQNQYALVDSSDFEALSLFNWYAKWDEKTRSFYAGRNVRSKDGKYHGHSITMHKQIISTQKGKLVDHINHNTLDNRKENLRVVSYAQNLYNMRTPKDNTSGYKGVSWDKATEKWIAYIRKHGILKYLGRFLKVEEAASAYNTAAEKFFGEYALINRLN